MLHINKNIMQFKNSVSDHKVINSIRFMAICSVVWGHCNLTSASKEFSATSDVVLQSVTTELGRLGTIIFFIISGFLMRPQINNYTIWRFLKGRFNNTLLPWMLFVLLFAVLELYNNDALKATITHGSTLQLMLNIMALVKAGVFYFAYWFVVVFVISAMVLILLKKYIDAPWLGAALALITLLYCINLHYGWINAHHTKAFFGYVFFMWLGIQMRRYYGKFVVMMQHINWWLLISAMVLSFTLACYEAWGLNNAGCTDPYASIRLTNIIASVIAFCCFYKAGSIIWVDQLRLRRDIYGVYLLHSIIIYQLDVVFGPYFSNIHVIRSQVSFLNAQILMFIMIMIISISLVRLFRSVCNSLVQWWHQYLEPKASLLILGLDPSNGTKRPAAIFDTARIAALVIIPLASSSYLAGKLIYLHWAF